MLKGKQSWLLAARLTKLKNIHKAVYSFKQPRRKSDLIPKCPQVWLQYFFNLIMKRVSIKIKHLNPRELTHVICKARVLYAEGFYPTAYFNDLPPCYLWDEDGVGQWLVAIGFSHLKECFLQNHITGRKLIRVNVKFLSQIGIRHIDELTIVHKQIRLLLGLPPTRSLSTHLSSSLYEEYLWKRSYTGKNYDTLNFKSYCIQRGFPEDEFTGGIGKVIVS